MKELSTRHEHNSFINLDPYLMQTKWYLVLVQKLVSDDKKIAFVTDPNFMAQIEGNRALISRAKLTKAMVMKPMVMKPMVTSPYLFFRMALES